jgi:hypothetical protein
VPWGHFDGRIVDTDPEVKEAMDTMKAKLKVHAGQGEMKYVESKQAEREAHHTDENLPPIGLAGDWWSYFAQPAPTISLPSEE